MKASIIFLAAMVLLSACSMKQEKTEQLPTIDSTLQVKVTPIVESKSEELDAQSGQREPYGDYIVRYIVTDATTYKPIYNPLKITHMGIRVENTNAGVKTWEAKYQGPIRLTNKGGSERFHNFYLTNQHVEFNISDRECAYYNGKWYYMIIFDGQVQLAEPRENSNTSISMNTKEKDYDLFINMMRNPNLSLNTFVAGGMNINNTQLLDRYSYESSPKVRAVFSKADGSFDKERFDVFYDKSCIWFEKLKSANYEEAVKNSAKYHRDNIFAPRY